MKISKQHIVSLLLFCFSLSVYAIDWNKVEAKQVTLFYPGQSSWEWVLTKSDHGGAKNFRKGKGCRECHQGEEKDMGNLIVAGKKLEPNPILGKRGYIDVDVKTAYDNSKFYMQLSWKETGKVVHNKMAKEQSKVTILFDDGHVKGVTRAGCWSACHDDATLMRSAPQDKDINLYLSKSRTKLTRKGGGENYQSDAALEKMLSDGYFIEFWQARLNQGQAVKAVDGYLLDKRYASELTQVGAVAELKNGFWTVEFSRKLMPNLPQTKNIVGGGVYSFGIAIHDEYTYGRHHHVSFLHTFALDQGKADFIAVRQ